MLLLALHSDFRYCKQAAKQYLGQAGLGLQEDKEQPWMLQPSFFKLYQEPRLSPKHPRP